MGADRIGAPRFEFSRGSVYNTAPTEPGTIAADGGMVPSIDEFNEVFESMVKGGTRYRTEKLAVASLFLFVAVATVVWVVSGIEIGRDLEGRLEAEGPSPVGERGFVVVNSGATGWHDVRIVVNDRYLATLEEVPAESRSRLSATDFEDYYYIPRPWGHAAWERAGSVEKPGRYISDDVEVRNVAARSREGRIQMELEGSS